MKKLSVFIITMSIILGLLPSVSVSANGDTDLEATATTMSTDTNSKVETGELTTTQLGDGKISVTLEVTYTNLQYETIKFVAARQTSKGEIVESKDETKTVSSSGSATETFSVTLSSLSEGEELKYYLWGDDKISLIDNAPSTVRNFKATSKVQGINLSWDAALDDSGIPVLYDIYKDGMFIATTDQTSYRIQGKEPSILKYSVIPRDVFKNIGRVTDIETSTFKMYFANADGTNYGIAYNPSTYADQDAYTVISTIDGVKVYTQEDMDDKIKYIYFSRSGCDITTEDRELVFEIDYKVRSNEELYFVYNAFSQEYVDTGKDTAMNWNLARANGTVSETIDLGGGWKTAVVRVSDAQLRESSMSSGSSFGIRIRPNTPSGTAVLVREIRVCRAEDYE